MTDGTKAFILQALVQKIQKEDFLPTCWPITHADSGDWSHWKKVLLGFVKEVLDETPEEPMRFEPPTALMEENALFRDIIRKLIK